MTLCHSSSFRAPLCFSLQVPVNQEHLSEDEKWRCLALFKANFSLSVIQCQMGRSQIVIGNFLRSRTQYITRKKGKSKRKLSIRTLRRISHFASSSAISCSNVKKDLSLNVSKMSSKWDASIVKANVKSAPHLELWHKTVRLDFARVVIAIS